MRQDKRTFEMHLPNRPANISFHLPRLIHTCNFGNWRGHKYNQSTVYAWVLNQPMLSMHAFAYLAGLLKF